MTETRSLVASEAKGFGLKEVMEIVYYLDSMVVLKVKTGYICQIS